MDSLVYTMVYVCPSPSISERQRHPALRLLHASGLHLYSRLDKLTECLLEYSSPPLSCARLLIPPQDSVSTKSSNPVSPNPPRTPPPLPRQASSPCLALPVLRASLAVLSATRPMCSTYECNQTRLCPRPSAVTTAMPSTVWCR